MDIVVEYKDSEYRFYEPTTDTLLISANLGEGFRILNDYLIKSGLLGTDILQTDDIRYHIDSETFRNMVKSNVDLLKRLQTSDTSEFKTSSDRFGGSSQSSFGTSGLLSKKGGFGRSEFGGKSSKFGKSDKKWKT